MSIDEEGGQRLGAGQPHPVPDAERPTDTEPPAQPAELSPEQLRQVRARLTRKYH